MVLSGNPRLNPFEDYVVPDKRAWVIEWAGGAEGSGGQHQLTVSGKYVARNATDEDGRLSARPGQTASVWLYPGATVGFANQKVIDSVRLRQESDSARPPFQVPRWLAPTIIAGAIIAALSWMVIDTLFGETDEHWQRAAEELKRPETNR